MLLQTYLKSLHSVYFNTSRQIFPVFCHRLNLRIFAVNMLYRLLTYLLTVQMSWSGRWQLTAPSEVFFCCESVMRSAWRSLPTRPCTRAALPSECAKLCRLNRGRQTWRTRSEVGTWLR